MPLKRAALPLCDEVSPQARLVGAVNTLLLGPGGRRTGTNTDVPGFVGALRDRGVRQVSSGLLVGVGATACSALAALAEIGIREVRAVARDPARAGELRALAEVLGVAVSVVPWEDVGTTRSVDIAVSTVPDEAGAAVAELVADRAEVVFDALYHPWPTRIAYAADKAGRVVVGGLDLLVHQAAVQVELMTGRTPAPVTAMRTAGELALAARRDVPDTT